jgi:hypothetical protein
MKASPLVRKPMLLRQPLELLCGHRSCIEKGKDAGEVLGPTSTQGDPR